MQSTSQQRSKLFALWSTKRCSPRKFSSGAGGTGVDIVMEGRSRPNACVIEPVFGPAPMTTTDRFIEFLSPSFRHELSKSNIYAIAEEFLAYTLHFEQ
jgi:hypothetical protein